MKGRLKILVSAYACGPDQGSEPGIGWNWVRQIARRNSVWVITRENNRAAIEAAVAAERLADVHFVYFDLPRWTRFWKRRRRGLYPYYYLWQLGAYFLGRSLHREIGFDIAQHVTFMTYWMPSFMSLLPVPFVWGPVGGGEAAPPAFKSAFGPRGRMRELLRDAAQAIGRLDPCVRITARRAALGLATTPETENCLKKLGCRRTVVCSPMGMPVHEVDSLGKLEPRIGPGFRLVSIGELFHWKGFELGINAFAQFLQDFPSAEYWLIGSGPERRRLELLVCERGISERVKFWGRLSRMETLQKLSQCDVLLHPSLHDSGGCVCSEAMLARRPIVCLDLGGPGLQVTEETGFKIPAISGEQVINSIALALRRLATDASLRARFGEEGRRRVQEYFAWDRKGDYLDQVYSKIVNPRDGAPRAYESKQRCSQNGP